MRGPREAELDAGPQGFQQLDQPDTRASASAAAIACHAPSERSMATRTSFAEPSASKRSSGASAAPCALTSERYVFAAIRK